MELTLYVNGLLLDGIAFFYVLCCSNGTSYVKYEIDVFYESVSSTKIVK